VAGLVVATAMAVLIVWIYARQPQTIAQVTGGIASTIGAYRIDQASFDDGLRFFRNDQFAEARAAFERADPAQRDARTQFYIAYSYYRQGWGRVYNDNELFARGLEVVDRAIALAPNGRLRVDDDGNLEMHSADELKAELQRGREVDASDFNPMRMFRKRK
jgi:tetratricopeptide (TPR) repeat protein